MRLWLLLGTALTLSSPAFVSAQQGAGNAPVPHVYLGPPETIDGPVGTPSPNKAWLDGSGSAVVMPDGNGALPLPLPGSPISDAIGSAIEGDPSSDATLSPQHIFVAPPQKISAYKNSFF